jgi:hypothetical protein
MFYYVEFRAVWWLLPQVIPQAVCSRYGLAIGASLVWLVKVLMLICLPVSYPVGKYSLSASWLLKTLRLTV